MILLSSRKNLGSNNTISSKLLSYSMPTKPDSEPENIQPMPLEEVAPQLAGKRVLVLVHGYKNNINNVQAAYRAILKNTQTHLADDYDVVVGYTWPSARSVFRWWKAKRNAEKVDQTFYKFLECLGTKHTDVMTHSLGAHVVLSGLQELGNTNDDVIRNLFLTAPAVDDESCELGEEYFEATRYCESVVAMYSRRDEVLRGAYSVADGGRALGLYGPRDESQVASNFFRVNCTPVVRSHGAYKRSPEVFGYVREHLAGTRKPYSILK